MKVQEFELHESRIPAKQENLYPCLKFGYMLQKLQNISVHIQDLLLIGGTLCVQLQRGVDAEL